MKTTLRGKALSLKKFNVMASERARAFLEEECGADVANHKMSFGAAAGAVREAYGGDIKQAAADGDQQVMAKVADWWERSGSLLPACAVADLRKLERRAGKRQRGADMSAVVAEVLAASFETRGGDMFRHLRDR